MDSAAKLINFLPKFKDEKQQKLALQVAGIAVASSLLYTSYKLIAGNKNKKQGIREIPVPGSSLPIVGHMFSLGEVPGHTISRWHAELGPILKIKMGAQIWIVVDDPELAHKIFVVNGAKTSYRPESVFAFKHYSMGGKGMAFAQYGASLKENRAAALTILAPKAINEKYMNSIKQESLDLVSRLIKFSEAEDGIDPLKYLVLDSMNVLFMACFGRKFNDIADPEFKRLTGINERNVKYAAVESDLGNFFPGLSFINNFAGIHAEQEKFIKSERDPLYRKLVQEALVSEGPNVVKSLEENGYNFTADEKLVLTSDMIVAGSDTVAVSLNWNFAIMCNHPEVQIKVAAEIDQFIKLHGRVPEFTERREVPYCLSVLKECMRYRPSTAFGVPHAACEDVEVDGYVIPKGAVVIVNMDSIHKKPTHYADPYAFHPDRYLKNLNTMQSSANGKFEDRDQFNFGFGSCICPGIYLAETEMFCAFIQVFARTFIEPVKGAMPNIEKVRNAGITLCPFPYKVKFVKRESCLL